MRSVLSMMLAAQLFAAICLLATNSAGSALAATHVLAIGIDEYDHQQQLGGAVRDAEDIAETFQRLGASVTLVRNREASRARIEDEWRAMLTRARSGDLVIFTYAGHGGQEPDKAPFDEEDGLDEAFLLSGFDPDPLRAGFGERILDDAIHDWFEEAGARGLKIILVADACYSGTMTRGIPDPRAVVTLRGSLPYDVPATVTLDQLKENAAQVSRVAVMRKEDPDYVTLLSATQENRNAPEVMIDGRSRGALSYAFARAVEGAADANRDGTISRFELEAYVGRQVRQLSEAQQAADLWPRRGNDVTIFELPAASAQADLRATNLGTLKLAILGLTATEAQDFAGKLDGVELAAAGEAVDLVWDRAANDVISGVGDPVAHEVMATGLQGVIDKWRTLAFLKREFSARAVDIRLEPGDGRHVEGSHVAILSEPLEQPFVTVIGIAPDGGLRLLYPLPSDPPRWFTGRPYRIENIEVQEPFGADHVLLIASDKPLGTLQASLKTLSIVQLPKLLEKELAGIDYRVALTGLYTVSRREER